MVQAYNFLGSWQLFPEKGTYANERRPKSGIYTIESDETHRKLFVSMNWISLEDLGFSSHYHLIPDGELHPFEDPALADQVKARFIDGISFETMFLKNNQPVLEVLHEIMPNGYMRITQKTPGEKGELSTTIEFYHKQLNVLPYAASVSGALIRPTETGMIRHKALLAMEEQTNMQLEQIRKQVELLALQAQEIHKRKELSLLIYEAKINFEPVIGHLYYVYEKKDGTYLVSMISPREWGGGAGPYKRLVSAVKLLADHTWMECM